MDLLKVTPFDVKYSLELLEKCQRVYGREDVEDLPGVERVFIGVSYAAKLMQRLILSQPVLAMAESLRHIDKVPYLKKVSTIAWDQRAAFRDAHEGQFSYRAVMCDEAFADFRELGWFMLCFDAEFKLVHTITCSGYGENEKTRNLLDELERICEILYRILTCDCSID